MPSPQDVALFLQGLEGDQTFSEAEVSMLRLARSAVLEFLGTPSVSIQPKRRASETLVLSADRQERFTWPSDE